MPRAGTLCPGAGVRLSVRLLRPRPSSAGIGPGPVAGASGRSAGHPLPLTVVPNIWAACWAGCRVERSSATAGGRPTGRPATSGFVPLAGHVLCNAQAIKDRLSGPSGPADRITVIRNGVNTEHYAPPESPPTAIGHLVRGPDGSGQGSCDPARGLRPRGRAHPTVRLRLVGTARSGTRSRPGPGKVRLRTDHDRSGDADLRPHYARRPPGPVPAPRGLPNVAWMPWPRGCRWRPRPWAGCRTGRGRGHGRLAPPGGPRPWPRPWPISGRRKSADGHGPGGQTEGRGGVFPCGHGPPP
jgi:hypothetical protein